MGSAAQLYYSAPLLEGDDGTVQTIAAIRALVDDAWKDSRVNRCAIDIIRAAGVAPYDSALQLTALYNWVLGNMYFIPDPVNKEALRPAADLLEIRAGDCDDINSILLPSLVGTVGFEPRLVTVAADPSYPGCFSHIYAEAKLNGRWVAIDAARPGAQLGLVPGRWFRREWWSLLDDSHGDYPDDQGMGDGAAPMLGQSVATDVLDAVAEGLSATPGIIRAVDGTPVYNVVTGAIGPGGTSLYAPATAASLNASASVSPTVLLIGGGLLLWLLMKGKR